MLINNNKKILYLFFYIDIYVTNKKIIDFVQNLLILKIKTIIKKIMKKQIIENQ